MGETRPGETRENRAPGSIGNVTSDTSHSSTSTSTRSRPSRRARLLRNPIDNPSSAPALDKAPANRASADQSMIRP